MRVARAVGDAIRTIVNTKAMGDDDPHPTYELLASYVDMVLRGKKGSERLSEERIKDLVKAVHDLFKHVSDKDVFKEHY